VLDDTVLARSVHSLQDQQDPARVALYTVGEELFLFLGQVGTLSISRREDDFGSPLGPDFDFDASGAMDEQ
jgi:hypothetical protein